MVLRKAPVDYRLSIIRLQCFPIQMERLVCYQKDAFGVTEDRGMCDESVGVCPKTRHTPHVPVSMIQYFDLMAYVSPMVNWKEFRLVGGNEAGGPFR